MLMLTRLPLSLPTCCAAMLALLLPCHFRRCQRCCQIYAGDRCCWLMLIFRALPFAPGDAASALMMLLSSLLPDTLPCSLTWRLIFFCPRYNRLCRHARVAARDVDLLLALCPAFCYAKSCHAAMPARVPPS